MHKTEMPNLPLDWRKLVKRNLRKLYLREKPTNQMRFNNLSFCLSTGKNAKEELIVLL